MNCRMLSGVTVDPTLYATNDDRSNLVDADTGMSSPIVDAKMAHVDAESPDLYCHWSSDETPDEGIDDDKRFFPSWLSEQHFSGTSWLSCYDGRLQSSTFSGDQLDGLSRDLWTLQSTSSLLDNNDDDDGYDNSTLLTRADDQSIWASYCSHVTSISTDFDCPADRCPSCESPSACSPTLTGIDGVELKGSSSGSYNSFDDIDERPARSWKRRRRRRYRRWTRQASLRTLYHGGDVLQSLLLDSSRYGGYRSPHQTAAKSARRSVSSEFGVVGHVTRGCDGHGCGSAVIPQQRGRIVSTPLIAGCLLSTAGDDANTEAISLRRHCLEDHCYFNWKQTPTTDCSTTSRHEDERRDSWSASVS